MEPDRLFFTSDMHYGHKNIISFCDRPFSSVEEMDEAMIEEWNSVVPPHSYVFVLGDISFRRPEETAAILAQLVGFKYLVVGNHDQKRMNRQVKDQFVWVKDYYELALQGCVGRQKIVMSHYPMLSWNGSVHGSWMLHGHCHNKVNQKGAYRLDVGVDSAYEKLGGFQPFSYYDVRNIMGQRKQEREALEHGVFR